MGLLILTFDNADNRCHYDNVLSVDEGGLLSFSGWPLQLCGIAFEIWQCFMCWRFVPYVVIQLGWVSYLEGRSDRRESHPEACPWRGYWDCHVILSSAYWLPYSKQLIFHEPISRIVYFVIHSKAAEHINRGQNMLKTQAKSNQPFLPLSWLILIFLWQKSKTDSPVMMSSFPHSQPTHIISPGDCMLYTAEKHSTDLKRAAHPTSSPLHLRTFETEVSI